MTTAKKRLNYEDKKGNRDIRAKAGTDTAESTGDIYRAQQQLGHSTVAMTHQYIRNRRGDKIKPTSK